MKYLSSIQNFWNKNLEIEVPSTSLIYLYLLHKWHEANYENLGRGRPAFRDLVIDLIKQKNPQGKLF